jgi:archaemetzincin
MRFKIPSNTQRQQALDLGSIDVHKRIYYQPDPRFFKPLTDISRGDWLDAHPEPGQTFREYTSCGFNQVKGSTRNVIYIMCLDERDENYLIDVNILKESLASFYYPMRVSVIDRPPSSHRFRSRMNNGVLQWFVPDIFSMLRTMIPNDAYCLLGFTMVDLYPREDWNFVFGQASISGRYGCFSFARYHPSFYDPRIKFDLETTKSIMLRRSCRVCIHEIGHMFGIMHCIYYHCIMNGSNHLEESERRPSHLCPIDLRKLQYCIGFDELERYRMLLAFYSKYQRHFPEEKEWTEQYLTNLENKSSHEL